MDTALGVGNPRHNESGTLLEGIVPWAEAKPHLAQEIIAERALRYCDFCAIPTRPPAGCGARSRRDSPSLSGTTA